MDLKYFKAGYIEEGFQYDYFIPEEISEFFYGDHFKLSSLLEKATLKLGELNSLCNFMPDISFLNMHILKEAVCSSRIAGIPISIREFLFSELELDSQKKDYKKEVENYSAAIKQGVRRLRDLFLLNRLIKTMHRTLFNKVSGQDKKTGEFRSSQNRIGGASLKDAFFIPPIPNELDDLLVDFELFLNQKMEMPHLIRAAIAHYQFETIHPFLDGNGRIGKLLITLYLIAKKVLIRPLLYISSYFEKYEELYYTKLSQVRKNNNLVEWIKFF